MCFTNQTIKAFAETEMEVGLARTLIIMLSRIANRNGAEEGRPARGYSFFKGERPTFFITNHVQFTEERAPRLNGFSRAGLLASLPAAGRLGLSGREEGMTNVCGFDYLYHYERSSKRFIESRKSHEQGSKKRKSF